jgi:transcriptional regulator with XRE-family HTH domain
MSERTEIVTTRENPYHFIESGLSNIYLIGIRCIQSESGKMIPEIPAVKQLLQLIARDIIIKPSSLNGDEVRFLRKRLGKKQTDFSRAIGIEPETLSRAENNHQPLGETTDKLIRFYYALAAIDDSHLNEMRVQIDRVLSEWHASQQPPKKRVASVHNDEWQLQAA